MRQSFEYIRPVPAREVIGRRMTRTAKLITVFTKLRLAMVIQLCIPKFVSKVNGLKQTKIKNHGNKNY